MIDELAYITFSLSGIGGSIKQRAEDFVVDEQPLYPPAGEGEHLYLYVEKRLLSTSDVIRHLADVFHVGADDVGYAGLKDKRAVTRQHFSVRLPHRDRDQELLKGVQNSHIKLIWAKRHVNKLQRGHLAGNNFVIYVRDVDPAGAPRAKRILDHLVRTGVPNFVGPQRFGYRMVNHKIGRLLLVGKWQELLDLMLGHPLESDHAPTRAAREAYERGDFEASFQALPAHLYPDRCATNALRRGKSPYEAVMAISHRQRVFYISAFQSAIFNRILDRRLRESDLPGVDRLVEGDLAWKHDSRSVFLVDQSTADRENGPEGRIKTLEVSPSGPMWGVDMCRAGNLVEQWENWGLEQEAMSQADLVGGPQGIATGSRRPMRVVVRDVDVSSGADDHGPFIRIAFGLPRGSFATVVLREIMKLPAEPSSKLALEATGAPHCS